jgi:hypothetical protein
MLLLSIISCLCYQTLTLYSFLSFFLHFFPPYLSEFVLPIAELCGVMRRGVRSRDGPLYAEVLCKVWHEPKVGAPPVWVGSVVTSMRDILANTHNRAFAVPIINVREAAATRKYKSSGDLVFVKASCYIRSFGRYNIEADEASLVEAFAEVLE